MKTKKNKLPDFDKMTRQEEADWWDTHDAGDYWDQFENVEVIVNLSSKPKEETLILRLQKEVKDRLEYIAKKRGLYVADLARIWLIEKLHTIKS